MEKGDIKRAARAQGLKRYRNNRNCKHGHQNPERFTSCGRCVECHRITKAKRWWASRISKAMRQKKYGYDPFDLRVKRKERGLGLSPRKDLVTLREKRKLYGRADRRARMQEVSPDSR